MACVRLQRDLQFLGWIFILFSVLTISEFAKSSDDLESSGDSKSRTLVSPTSLPTLMDSAACRRTLSGLDKKLTNSPMTEIAREASRLIAAAISRRVQGIDELHRIQGAADRKRIEVESELAQLPYEHDLRELHGYQHYDPYYYEDPRMVYRKVSAHDAWKIEKFITDFSGRDHRSYHTDDLLKVGIIDFVGKFAFKAHLQIRDFFDLKGPYSPGEILKVATALETAYWYWNDPQNIAIDLKEKLWGPRIIDHLRSEVVELSQTALRNLESENPQTPIVAITMHQIQLKIQSLTTPNLEELRSWNLDSVSDFPF